MSSPSSDSSASPFPPPSVPHDLSSISRRLSESNQKRRSEIFSSAPIAASPPSDVLESLSLASSSDISEDSASSDSSSLSSLLHEISSLRSLLNEKDSDLSMAGEMGSILVQQNEAMVQEIENLKKQNEENTNKYLLLEGEFKGIERKLGRHREEITNLENLNTAMEDKYNKIQQENLTLLTKMDALQKGNGKNGKSEDSEESEMMRKSIMDKENKMISQQKEIKEITLKLRDSHDTVEMLEAKVKISEELEEKHKNILDKYAESQRQLAELKKTAHSLSEVNLDNERLQRSCNELSEMLRQMNEMRENDGREMMEWKLKIQNYKEKIDKLERDQQFSPLKSPRGEKSSLADDLEMEDQKEEEKEKISIPPSTPQQIRRPSTVSNISVPPLPLPVSVPPSTPTPSVPLDHSLIDLVSQRLAEGIKSPPPNPLPEIQSRKPPSSPQLFSSPPIFHVSSSSAQAQRTRNASTATSHQQGMAAATAGFSSYYSNMWGQPKSPSSSSGPIPVPSTPISKYSSPLSASSVTNHAVGLPIAQPIKSYQSSYSLLPFESTSHHPLNTPTVSPPPQTDFPVSGGSRDADLEFFSLTLLSCKINSGKKFENLYFLSTSDLRNKAKKEGIQFHQYHRWIENELTKAYIQSMYNKNHNPLQMSHQQQKQQQTPFPSTFAPPSNTNGHFHPRSSMSAAPIGVIPQEDSLERLASMNTNTNDHHLLVANSASRVTSLPVTNQNQTMFDFFNKFKKNPQTQSTN